MFPLLRDGSGVLQCVAVKSALPEALFPLQDRRLAPDLAASPLYTLAVGQRLALAVANDCGTAHMLAAVGCKMVSLFQSLAPR